MSVFRKIAKLSLFERPLVLFALTVFVMSQSSPRIVDGALSCNDIHEQLVWTVGNFSQGWVHPHLIHTYRVYDELLNTSLSPRQDSGSQFAVVVNGLCTLLHAWGGNQTQGIGALPVTNQTLFNAFSVGKGFLPLVAAYMSNTSLIDYNEIVATKWPAFGQFGKSQVKFKHVTSHQDGLLHNNPIFVNETKIPSLVDGIVTSTAPLVLCFKTYCYHTFSIGYILDAILRHVDPSARNIQQYFQDKFLSHFAADTFEFHWTYNHTLIGSRLATLDNPIAIATLDGLGQFVCQARTILPVEYCYAIGNPTSTSLLEFQNATWLEQFYNPSVLFITNALSVARFYSVLVTRKFLTQNSIINASAVSEAAQIEFDGIDASNGEQVVITKGGWSRNPIFNSDTRVIYRDGLSGAFGGGHVDFNVGIGYVTNYIKTPDHLKDNYLALGTALFQDLNQEGVEF